MQHRISRPILFAVLPVALLMSTLGVAQDARPDAATVPAEAPGSAVAQAAKAGGSRMIAEFAREQAPESPAAAGAREISLDAEGPSEGDVSARPALPQWSADRANEVGRPEQLGGRPGFAGRPSVLPVGRPEIGTRPVTPPAPTVPRITRPSVPTPPVMPPPRPTMPTLPTRPGGGG
jgi:hypothetical protein